MRDEDPTGSTTHLPSELVDDGTDMEVLEGEIVPRRLSDTNAAQRDSAVTAQRPAAE